MLDTSFQVAAVEPSVADQLDLPRRLQQVPSTAHSRGIFFNMIADDLKRRGKQVEARRILGPSRKVYGYYPTRDLLVAFAMAAPIVDPDAREAVRQIFGSGSRYFAGSWLGRALQRFIRPDPTSALHWLENSRDHLCDYGQWRLERVHAGHVVMHMFDEYIWIDTAHRGGCEGLLAACGVTGEVVPAMEGAFSGRLDVRWKPLMS